MREEMRDGEYVQEVICGDARVSDSDSFSRLRHLFLQFLGVLAVDRSQLKLSQNIGLKQWARK